MQRNMMETILGAIVLAVAAGFLFFAYETADLKPVDGYELKAKFTRIDGLETGSDVKISGVKVGTVLGFALDPNNFLAIVRMNIRNDIQLPADTAAIIASEGLLNGKFLALEPGGDEEMIAPGGVIQYTQSTPSLEQLLGQVIFSLNKDGTSESGGAGKAGAGAGADDGNTND